MIDLQFSMPNLIFLIVFFFLCTHVNLIRNKKSKSNLDKVIFDGERYFRNTHF